jgi:hypothetical protein
MNCVECNGPTLREPRTSKADFAGDVRLGDRGQRTGHAARWLAFNAGGFALGLTLFGAIGHGFTGDHGDALALAQLIAHTIGLVVATPIIAAAHHLALARTRRRALHWRAALFGVPLLFWAGYYGLGIPFDLLLAFTLLGWNAGRMLAEALARPSWRWRGPVCFAAGFGATAAATYPLADSLQAAFGGGLAGHVTLFAFIGSAQGLASGAAVAALLLASPWPDVWR